MPLRLGINFSDECAAMAEPFGFAVMRCLVSGYWVEVFPPDIDSLARVNGGGLSEATSPECQNLSCLPGEIYAAAVRLTNRLAGLN